MACMAAGTDRDLHQGSILKRNPRVHVHSWSSAIRTAERRRRSFRFKRIATDSFLDASQPNPLPSIIPHSHVPRTVQHCTQYRSYLSAWRTGPRPTPESPPERGTSPRKKLKKKLHAMIVSMTNSWPVHDQLVYSSRQSGTEKSRYWPSSPTPALSARPRISPGETIRDTAPSDARRDDDRSRTVQADRTLARYIEHLDILELSPPVRLRQKMGTSSICLPQELISNTSD